MKAEEIYKNLCEFRNKAQEAGFGMSPNEMKKLGVSIIKISTKNTSDESSREKYIGDDGGYVIEDYWYSDHCRTFEIRPDTNHFKISLYDEEGNMIDAKSYCYDDDA